MANAISPSRMEMKIHLYAPAAFISTIRCLSEQDDEWTGCGRRKKIRQEDTYHSILSVTRLWYLTWVPSSMSPSMALHNSLGRVATSTSLNVLLGVKIRCKGLEGTGLEGTG